MKLLMVILASTLSLAAHADSGLECTMSYSSTHVLASSTDSSTRWLVAGQKMEGSTVAADKNGGWTEIPANSLSVSKNGKLWTVEIQDSKKQLVGSFSFPEKQSSGMKATLATDAFMANESEDPPKYEKLEVSCFFTVFAG